MAPIAKIIREIKVIINNGDTAFITSGSHLKKAQKFYKSDEDSDRGNLTIKKRATLNLFIRSKLENSII
jgi:hypothetical protein